MSEETAIEQEIEVTPEEQAEETKTVDQQIAEIEQQEPTLEEVEKAELEKAELEAEDGAADPGEIDYDNLTEEQLLELVNEELESSAHEKKGSKIQARIDELTRNRREAERRATQAEGELQHLRQVLSGDKEPVQEDFDEYADFVKATAKWAARQEKLAVKEQELKQTHDYIDRSAFEFQIARMQEGVKADAGFGDKADALSQVFNPGHEAYHAVFESEYFVPMVQWLSSNLNEAQRIANLSPRAQAREIIRLEDAIQAGTLRLPKPSANRAQTSPLSRRNVSAAPAPIRPTVGRETVNKSIDKMSMEEYAAHRRAQLKSRR